MPKYAVAPQYAMVPYPTPPAYVRPPPVYVTPPPVYITPPPTTTTTIPPPKCFQNTQGYKCCNRQLDQFLEQKVGEMLKPEWQRCNLQRFATQLQVWFRVILLICILGEKLGGVVLKVRRLNCELRGLGISLDHLKQDKLKCFQKT